MLHLYAFCSSATRPTLEDLAYAAGTDKSHDDHKYTDLYASLFEPLRSSVLNFTEIGVSAGQSLLVWHDFFFNAHIFGVDIRIFRSAKSIAAKLPRCTLHQLGSANAAKLERLGLARASMDVVLDDGDHFPLTQMQAS